MSIYALQLGHKIVNGLFGGQRMNKFFRRSLKLNHFNIIENSWNFCLFYEEMLNEKVASSGFIYFIKENFSI